MAFSGEDETKVLIDGYSQQLMTPYGGAEGVIGCVANVKALAKKITRELSTGVLMAGIDQVHQGELAQTSPADFANMAGAIALSQSKIKGNATHSVITAPTGRKLWMNFDTEQSYSNKSDSKMTYEVTKPGQSVASLSSFVVAAS